jgi:hypothetical protein
MAFDIDTDIPVIAEYARSYGQHKSAMQDFLRYLMRQTSAYAELEMQHRALASQVEQIKDEMTKIVIDTPDI